MANGFYREGTGQYRQSWDEQKIQQLFEEFQRTRDHAIKEKIFHESQGLAAYFARKYAEQPSDFDDLYQEASLGIFRAIERYDPHRGVKFFTYAARCAEGSVRQYFRDKSWLCYVPRKTKDYAYRIKRMSDELGHDLDRQEIIECAEVPFDEVDNAILASNLWNRVSIYCRHSGAELTDEANLASSYVDDELEDIPSNLFMQNLIDCTLTPFEALVVRLHIFEDLPQNEIADRLDTYQMKVSRALRTALRKLRHVIPEDDAE